MSEKTQTTPEDILEFITKRIDALNALMEKGKGVWPEQSYVKDETWANWSGGLYELNQVYREFTK